MDFVQTKVLKIILGPVDENRKWETRFNTELYNMYKHNYIRTCVRIDPLILVATVEGRDMVGDQD